MRKPQLVILLLAVIFLNNLTQGSAAVTVYTNKSAWAAALGNIYSTETFDSGPFNTYGSIVLNPEINIIANNHGFIPNTSLTWHDQIDSNDPTIFNFQDSIQAFGADWDLTSYWIGTPNPLVLSLNNVPVTPSITQNGFFGVISTTPFTSAKISLGGGAYSNWDINNLVYSPVPEPSLVLPVIVAFAAMLFVFIKRRKNPNNCLLTPVSC
jgi:hypothetical protein